MRTTLLRTLMVALAAGALLAAAAARADSACMDDARRFCPDVPFGEGRVMACLQAHQFNLSSACVQDLQRVQAKAREIHQDCAADVWSYCQGVAPGEGRVRECLWARWSELSSTCKETSARLAEKAQQLWDRCQDDAQRLCAGMKMGQGRIYLCLKAQESQVTGPCRQALR